MTDPENSPLDSKEGTGFPEPYSLPEKSSQDRLKKVRKSGEEILRRLGMRRGESEQTEATEGSLPYQESTGGGKQLPTNSAEGPHGQGEEESSEGGTVEEQGEEGVESEDPIIRYLQSIGLEEKRIEGIKEIIAADSDELIRQYLADIGVPEVEMQEAIEGVKASPVRLTLARLRELGLPEDKIDEAHKILVSEKGRLKLKHIIDLGFGPEKAEEVHNLLKSSPAKLLREKLESLGVEQDRIDEIVSVDDDREKLIEALLRKHDFGDNIIAAILKIEKEVKVEEELSRELGYGDEEKIQHAHALGINQEAIKRGRELGYPLDLLIAAVEQGDKSLHKWLVEMGIALPGEVFREPGEEPPTETRKEGRKKDRLAARVTDLYPPGDPNVVTKSETQYFVERIEQRPGWIGRSLISPGSLGASRLRKLYDNPITRPALDLLNYFYHPVGQRLLARQLFKDKKTRYPEDDYGPTGYGQEKRRQVREHVTKVDKTIKRARRLLSRRQRNVLRGDIRKNARLDLAAEISEVRRDILAFSMGREKLPDEREQYDMLRDSSNLSPAQQARFEALERLHPKWTSEEYLKLEGLPHRNFDQQSRFEYLARLNPE